MKKLAITLIITIALSGCATSNKFNFSSISLGMDKEEILSLKGEPYRTAAIDGFEYFIYRGFDLKIMFDDGSSGTYEAFVRFKDEKVDAYGRLDDFESTRHKELLIRKTKER